MRSEKMWDMMGFAVALAAIVSIIGLLIISPPPASSKMPKHSSEVRVLSRHHHPQPTKIDDEQPLSAEVGDRLEVILAPQERITRPVTELRMYCPHMNAYWYTFANTKPTVINLEQDGYCRIVLIESLLPVPPGTGQFERDILKLRQLPQHFNCRFNPLFTQVLVVQ